MTNQRLYYFDAYTTRFQARIVERVQQNDQAAVVLDKTYFYPTSGGQPADHGQINQVPVLDVSIREKDQAILHWLGNGEITADEVQAEIDWSRRFDHMQQHSGQHILSQAFIQVAEAQTVGFHLTADRVTIDLDCDELSPGQIARAEQLANKVIWQNRPIKAIMVSAEEATKLSLRKMPPGHQQELRLIDIQNFDLTACGGTHVESTGAIGMIKVIKTERNRRQMRIEFRCGKRALQDYEIKNTIIGELTTSLTTGQSEILGAIERMREEVKEARRTIKQQQSELLAVEARRLLQEGQKSGDLTLISQQFNEQEPGFLRALAAQLVRQNRIVALLGSSGAKAHLVFSRSADAPGEMNQLLKRAMGILGSNAGGGSATFAQGGGPSASQEQLAEAIAAAERLFWEQSPVSQA